MNDLERKYQLLQDQHLGLCGVVNALIACLRQSGQVQTESLQLHLEAFAMVYAQNEDQRLPFDLALKTMDEPRWVPRVIQGGPANLVGTDEGTAPPTGLSEDLPK